MQGVPYLLAVPLAAAGMAVALAAFILLRGSRRLANVGFAVGLILLGLQEVFVFLALWPETGEAALGAIRLATAARVLLPIPWLVFALSFASDDARPRIRAWSPVLLACGALGLTAIVVMPSPAMFQIVTPPGAWEHVIVLGALGKAAHAAVLLGVVGVLVNLESLLRLSTGGTRRRVKHLLIGLFVAFAAEIYAISRFLLFALIDVEALLIEAAGLLLAGAFVAVTTLRHRLFEVEVFVSRHVAYRSATLALVGGYLLALGMAGEALRRFDIPMRSFFLGAGGFAALLILGVAVFSEHVRRRIKLYIDTHFYRHKHDYRQRWIEFTRSLGPAVRLEEVLPRLLGTLMAALWVDRVAVFLTEAPGGDLVLAEAAGLDGPTAEEGGRDAVPGRIQAGRPLHAQLADGRVVDLHDWAGGRESVGELGLVLLAPMEGPEGLMGVLAVGPELTGHPFTAEDHDLLATIAAQAATTIVTARLSQDLATAKGMEALHRLAAFLLHDLKNCASTLTMVTVNAREHIGDPEFQRDALQAISATAARMRRLIARLSALPSGPEMKREPVELSRVVGEALAEFRSGLQPGVALKTDLRPTPGILGDPTQIGRVVTNLVVNALEAVGKAGAVSVETFPEGSWACIRVADTGPGIPEGRQQNGLFQPFRSTKRGGLGIGLYQCKTIVDAHGGRIEVQSQQGRGTSFTLRFPLIMEEAGAPVVAGAHPGLHREAMPYGGRA